VLNSLLSKNLSGGQLIFENHKIKKKKKKKRSPKRKKDETNAFKTTASLTEQREREQHSQRSF
jgi:hypothetical protein